MRIAYQAATLIDVHLVKDALERADIPVFVAGEYLTGGVGQLPATDYVHVMVPDAALPAAEGIVREIEAVLCEARGVLQEGDPDGLAPSSCPA